MKTFVALFLASILFSSHVFATTNSIGCALRTSDMYSLNAINSNNEYIVNGKSLNTPVWGVYYNMIVFYDNIDIGKSKNIVKDAVVNDEFVATSFTFSDTVISIRDMNNNSLNIPITSTVKDNNGKIKSMKGVLNSTNSLVFNGKKFGEDKLMKFYSDNYDAKLDTLKDYVEGASVECDFAPAVKCALSLVKSYSSTVTY